MTIRQLAKLTKCTEKNEKENISGGNGAKQKSVMVSSLASENFCKHNSTR